jgi:hypothetical protein
MRLFWVVEMEGGIFWRSYRDTHYLQNAVALTIFLESNT